VTSHRGKFLVASARLNDPNFARSVVLLVQHDEEGATGLILNRPIPVTIGQATDDTTTPAAASFIRRGGPCSEALVALHTRADLSDREALPGVHFSIQRDQVAAVMQQVGDDALYFAGYSGWSPGQLEDEIDTGSWQLVPATIELVFDHAADLWPKLSTHATLGGRLPIDQIPDDPSVN
jgi:putative transcriptional regulator